jgi:hypothetical protein
MREVHVVGVGMTRFGNPRQLERHFPATGTMPPRGAGTGCAR